MFQIKSVHSNALWAKPGHLAITLDTQLTKAAYILEKWEGRHIWVRRERYTCDIPSLIQASKQDNIIFHFLEMNIHTHS
jgi:hypothetical protein